MPETAGNELVITRTRYGLAILALLFTGPLPAVTELLYDTEPNDAPHEAVSMALPSGKDTVRIIGELEGQDQDAYRIVVDEDLAGQRFELQITGRGGVLTRLDIFDFSKLADAHGRIPEELSARPEMLMTLKTDEGTRPARVDGLLLAPGVYLLGVSHSGGEGTYTVDVGPHDDKRVDVLEDEGSAEQPASLSTRGRTVVWTQDETWFEFEIGDEQADQAWNLAFQTPLGRDATLELLDGGGTVLLSMESKGGQALERPGLTLEPGTYRLRTRSATAGVQMFRLESGAASPADGREVEPNDRSPTPIAFGQNLAGRFDEGDTDWLAFDVTDEEVGRVVDLELKVPSEAQAEVCLIRKAIDLSHCVRGSDGLTALRNLGLVEGGYQLRMRDRKRGVVDWHLNWIERDRNRPGQEVEPNDKHHHAVALHERGFGRGHFVGRETDHWRFSVTGEPQLWRVQLQGENLFELTLKNAAGRTLTSERAGKSQRVRLDNLFLLPGDYILAAAGTDADYILRLVELGPPPEGMEMEPNDDVASANPLHFGVEHFGTLAESKDTDRFAFTLNGYERVRITVQPPVDGSIRGILATGDEAGEIADIRNREVGEKLVWDMYLPPADYSLKLTPREPSDAEYRVHLERMDYLVRISDREPNDTREVAAPFPEDGRIAGRVGMTARSEDWYELPVPANALPAAFPRQDGVRVSLFAESGLEDDLLEYDREILADRASLRPGQRHWLRIRGDGRYEFDLSELVDEPPAPSEQALEVEVSFDRDVIQAFSPWGQKLGGELTVSNLAGQSRTVQIYTHATDARWQLETEADHLRLEPGQAQKVPIEVYIPADMPTTPSVQFSAHARDRFGEAAVVHELEVDSDAPPVRPVFHWSVPEALRGGFNVAAQALGAEPVVGPNMDEEDVENSAELYDGLARLGRWTEFKLDMRADSASEFMQPTVRLATEEPVPVAGFLINPTAALSARIMLRDFELALSLDGEHFNTVLTGQLEPIAEEQAFVLDEPVQARYARLIPIRPQFAHLRIGIARLGEFKVVAEPGWRPHDESFNLADPDLGGHLVWAEPWIRGSAFNRSLLQLDDNAARVRLRGAGEARVVLGFHHNRAARIDRIVIEPLAKVLEDRQPASVRVSAALDSPLGPWEPLAEAPMDAGRLELVLDEPTWARYVRLTFEGPEGSSNLQLPDRIAVFESPGPSVVGEWGFYADAGPREASDIPQWQAIAGTPENTSRQSARPLESGRTEPGRALLDQYSAWYRMEAPAGRNLVEIEVNGVPTVEARPRLFNAAGDAVEIYQTEADARRHLWQAWIEPATSYWLELYEPPRSVIFSWDTSASVGRYLPSIANALLAYAETIKPGRDEVNLLPFGRGSPLLKNWVGHSYPLMKMLAGYPHETSSSAAEKTLAVAAREMIDRPGKKGVVLLTDAATTSDASLWPALNEGRPQVFGMKLSSEGAFGGDPDTELDLMQDWARVRGGHFSYVTSFGVLSNGFERAVARLKAPVDFTVAAAFEQVENPEPASIAVVSTDDGSAGGDPAARGAVEIILDASGSMLKRMGGQRRIDIAKAAIRSTVEETLPEGIPLALRVYGHREAGSCRTDLEIPLEPLEKTAFLKQVESIEAINLAKTPIADSLAAVASDLNAVEGRRLVVLLTDGEETCEGDPAAEIEKLKESGLDVNINIVGFAIDDDDLKREFAAWAALGGGEYLDAGEAESLNEAMTQALQIPFEVIDSEGEPIARGLVDSEPIEVPPGAYQVKVYTASTVEFRNLSVAPGELLELTLDNQ